jgi:hypothetical protein
MDSLRLTTAAIFASIPLIFGGASSVSSGAVMIDKESFQPSTKDFTACKIKASSSFSQKAIRVASGELELDIVQLDDGLYCIHLKDTKTLSTQSLIIRDYEFLFVLVPDIIYQGQIVPKIVFRGGFLNITTIAIMDGRIILTR